MAGLRSRWTLVKYGWLKEITHPDRAWTKTSFSPLDEHKGKFLLQATLGHPINLHRDWRKVFDNIEITGAGTYEKRDVYTVELGRGELPPIVAQVDAKSGDILQTKMARLQGVMGAIPTTTTFGNYQEVFGMRIPLRAASSDEHGGTMTIELDKPTRYKGDPASVFPKAP